MNPRNQSFVFSHDTCMPTTDKDSLYSTQDPWTRSCIWYQLFQKSFSKHRPHSFRDGDRHTQMRSTMVVTCCEI